MRIVLVCLHTHTHIHMHTGKHLWYPIYRQLLMLLLLLLLFLLLLLSLSKRIDIISRSIPGLVVTVICVIVTRNRNTGVVPHPLPHNKKNTSDVAKLRVWRGNAVLFIMMNIITLAPWPHIDKQKRKNERRNVSLK